jgi:hypothetical protein
MCVVCVEEAAGALAVLRWLCPYLYRKVKVWRAR